MINANELCRIALLFGVVMRKLKITRLSRRQMQILVLIAFPDSSAVLIAALVAYATRFGLDEVKSNEIDLFLM